MVFNFKKSVFSQKRHILFVLSFCVLFSLFFSPALYAVTDEKAAAELTKFESQLKEKSLSSIEVIESILQNYIVEDRYHNGKIVVYEISDELIKRRNDLVAQALDSCDGADKNEFLKIVASQLVQMSSKNYPLPLAIQKQEDLVEMALKKGAKFLDIEIERFGNLPSLKTAELMLDNSFDPNHFLKLIFMGDHWSFYANSELVSKQHSLIYLALKKGGKFSAVKNIWSFKTLPEFEIAKLMLADSFDPSVFLALVVNVYVDSPEPFFRQKELVELALKNGADPNYVIKSGKSLCFCSAEIMELLFNNNYKKIDPDLFYHYLWVNGRSYYEVNGLNQLLDSPSLVLDKKYKNLNAKPAATLKIPRIIYYIWLTSNKKPLKLSDESIENIISNKEKFSHKAGEWKDIIWTNDRKLILDAAKEKKLKENNIQVREISEVKDHLKLYEKAVDLIEQGGWWGMVSDILRYDLVNYMGGVYADVNFKFNRDVDAEMYKYDFFTQADKRAAGKGFPSFENCFFGSKANHPILEEVLKLVERNLINPPEYIAIWDRKEPSNARVITNSATYEPLYIAYYKAANNGTVDVVYPSYYDHIAYYEYDNDVSPHYVNATVSDDPAASVKSVETEYERLRRQKEEVIKKYVNYDQADKFEADEKKAREYVQSHEICGIERHVIGDDDVRD